MPASSEGFPAAVAPVVPSGRACGADREGRLPARVRCVGGSVVAQREAGVRAIAGARWSGGVVLRKVRIRGNGSTQWFGGLGNSTRIWWGFRAFRG